MDFSYFCNSQRKKLQPTGSKVIGSRRPSFRIFNLPSKLYALLQISFRTRENLFCGFFVLLSRVTN
jgi:hypothetical protein